MLDGSEVGDNQRRTPCGDKHLVPIGFRLSQGQYRRRRYLVRLETHQCSVDVEKQGITLHDHLFLCKDKEKK